MISMILGWAGISSAQSAIQLKTGDLLFREAVSEDLSEAIDQVTQTEKQTHYSHVGLVAVDNDSVFVLHASPSGGTCRITLEKFCYPDEDSVQVAVYRLKKPWGMAIPKAITEAYVMLGKPYNFSYILSDSSHYCSEFIYRAFAADSIFELNPMTFKDPKTGEFALTWIAYYKKLGVEIPEGQPGCNPNGMAASEKLDYLGVL